QVYRTVRADLRYLDENPDAPDRAERIAAMVASTEPLQRLLGQRIRRPDADHAALLEVLVRRYYGPNGLRSVTHRRAGDRPLLGAEITGDSARLRLLATVAAVDVPAQIAELAHSMLTDAGDRA